MIKYLIIKFIFGIQNYIQTNVAKFVKRLLNMDYDAHYHLAKCQIKIQLVYMKKQK
jgi:hypothetical protein